MNLLICLSVSSFFSPSLPLLLNKTFKKRPSELPCHHGSHPPRLALMSPSPWDLPLSPRYEGSWGQLLRRVHFRTSLVFILGLP